MGKTFIYVSVGIIVFLVFFIFLTWLAIRNTSEDWSKKGQFISMVDKPFQTNVPVFLTKQFEKDYYKEGYLLTVDTSGADSTSITFPAGTEVRFTSVEYTKRGVSGVEYLFILGTIKNNKGENIPFEYLWATPKFYHENESDKWSYNVQFWK